MYNYRCRDIEKAINVIVMNEMKIKRYHRHDGSTTKHVPIYTYLLSNIRALKIRALKMTDYELYSSSLKPYHIITYI